MSYITFGKLEGLKLRTFGSLALLEYFKKVASMLIYF